MQIRIKIGEKDTKEKHYKKKRIQKKMEKRRAETLKIYCTPAFFSSYHVTADFIEMIFFVKYSR
jgi:hypothetical protein